MIPESRMMFPNVLKGDEIVKRVILVIVILASILIIWYKSPQYKHRTLDGIQFQLGAAIEQDVQAARIEMEGVFQRHFFSPTTFEGTIRINDELLPYPDSVDKKLKITLGDPAKEKGTIQFLRESYYHVPFRYGFLAVNHNISKLTIFQFKQHEQGYTYNTSDAMMISAPATNRAEASAVAHKLMGTFLRPKP